MTSTTKEIKTYLRKFDSEFELSTILKILSEEQLFKKTFTEKQQLFITFLFNKLEIILNFHAYDDSNPHSETIGKELAKLKKHRHELNRKYSTEPTF